MFNKNIEEPTYYAVYSEIGFGVYDSLYKLELNDQYFGNYKMQEFDWKDDASEWAIRGYNNLIINNKNNFHTIYNGHDVPKLNWFTKPGFDESRCSYYAVYSEKGLGIYNDYSMLKAKESYIGDYTMEKFNTRKEAERYAISSYNNLVLGTSHEQWTYHELPRISWFYFASKIDAGTALE